MNVRRMAAALLAVVLGAAMISALATPRPAAAAAPTGSAVTKSGDPKGPFASLKITVSQTTNLINQVVTVSWTGGAETLRTGLFNTNFLQIMQCWGDDQTNGPDRTQCQFGGVDTQQAGTWGQSRQVSYGRALVDPKETLKLPAGTFGNAFVPFWPVGKAQPVGAVNTGTNDFFDSQVDNEALVRTSADGTGLGYFEVQTVRQAAGLGCGDPDPTTGKGRSCWLVVVPRGSTEVDGTTRNANNNQNLDSSPLSQTNWDNRIVFPLAFQPVGQACPIGAAERRIIGNELVADAVSSWQPALCSSGATYSYGQDGDDVVRNLVLGGNSPGLALATNPIPPDQAPPDHPLLYAPVGLSGLAIAFNIERQPPDPTPGVPLTPAQQLSGQRFTSLKLTPRLVAKLLTQSYQAAVLAPSDPMKKNPEGLLFDPEFLDLNPEYKGSANNSMPLPDALVQLGGADVTSLLWSWIEADPDARAFLGGKPDPNGMVINPANQNLPLPTLTFPRNDQSCHEFNIATGVNAPLCTQDAHPFTVDMHDAGRSASRGDTQQRTVTVGSDFKTPVSTKVSRQLVGQRTVLAVVDAATATRYGLPMATLRNAAGKFVAPTTASLLAGEAAMKPSAVPSVLAADPTATDPAAYPLPALTYAMTSPTTLDAPAGKDYAAFLRYAAGPGQQPGVAPGQLPLGMAPLPDALKAQTIAAAATIEAQAGKTPPRGPGPQSPVSAGSPIGSGAGSTGGGSPVAPGTSGNPTAPGGGPGAPAGAVTPPTGPVSKTPTVVQQPVAVRRTPRLPAPAVGALLLTILISGALAATSSPVLQSPVAYRVSGAVRRALRRGVRSTEQ
jgi:hypothetical protein